MRSNPMRAALAAVSLAAAAAFSTPPLAVAAGFPALPTPPSLGGATAAELDRDGGAALNRLLATNPAAKNLSKQAVAVLVFPKVVKAGLMVGGQFGEGVLFKRGKPVAYYNTTGASYGMQAGAQTYGYALFFLSEQSLGYLNASQGFEVGAGPSVIVADQKLNKITSTTTIQNAIYAFIFSQKGAMAAMGIQGNKITKLDLAPPAS